MAKLYLILIIIFSFKSVSFAQNKGQIKFTFIKSETFEPVCDSTHIKIINPEDTIEIDIHPDVDGNYIYKPIDPSKYAFIIKVKGYQEKTIKKVKIYSDHTCYVAVSLIPLGKAKTRKKTK